MTTESQPQAPSQFASAIDARYWQHMGAAPYSAREAFKQAYRELRANGRIGYQVLRNPRARMAACEAFGNRLDGDSLDGARRRRAKLEYELFWRTA